VLVNLITAFGWIGAFAGIFAYLMVSRGKWIAASLTFQLTNVAAASAMFAVAAMNGVWPSAAANVAWLGIGVISTYQILKQREFSLRRALSLPKKARSLTAYEVSSASAISWSRVAGQGGYMGHGSHTRLAA